MRALAILPFVSMIIIVQAVPARLGTVSTHQPLLKAKASCGNQRALAKGAKPTQGNVSQSDNAIPANDYHSLEDERLRRRIRIRIR